jgi:hypothetical protein
MPSAISGWQGMKVEYAAGCTWTLRPLFPLLDGVGGLESM